MNENKGLKQSKEQMLINDGWRPEQVEKFKAIIDALTVKGYKADYNVNVVGSSSQWGTSMSIRYSGGGKGGIIHLGDADIVDTLPDITNSKDIVE